MYGQARANSRAIALNMGTMAGTDRATGALSIPPMGQIRHNYFISARLPGELPHERCS